MTGRFMAREDLSEEVTSELRNDRYEGSSQVKSYRKNILGRGNCNFTAPLGTGNQAEGAALRQNIRDRRTKQDGLSGWQHLQRNTCIW